MYKNRKLYKLISYVLFAFGIGILLSFLLSLRTLVVIEALLLVTIGVMWCLQR